ncbi:MAG TPA: PrsW family glutamic-type intramembrane protease [Stellaceae bacterium]|nr:PrsW family glutamic-type intramembrane protease [Stellaceae bacterium]
MDRLAILLCAMTPAMILLLYGVAKARGAWNDAVMWQMFSFGGVSAMLALLPETLLTNSIAVDTLSPVRGAAIQALFVAAIPEEAAKLLAFLYVAKRYGEGSRARDIITYALAVALGFAAIENLAYLVAPGEWQTVAWERALTAVPSHGIDGLAMGAFLTAAYSRRGARPLWLAMALVLPILLHAIYDFPLMLVAKNQAMQGVLPAWLLTSFLVTIGILALCNKMRSAAALADRRAPWAPPAQPAVSPRQAAAAILLVAPLLAGFLWLLIDGFAAIGAAVLGLLPIMLGIDLLLTGGPPAVVNPADRPGSSHRFL